MEHRLLAYQNSSISYYRFGRGPALVLCFHGYGEDATLFTFLEKYGGDQFSFLAFDLPFHGKTNWKEGLNFTPAHLLQIVEKILHEKNDGGKTGHFKMTLLGFSLGGRVALSFFQEQPHLVEKLILLAPDGLKENFWYWLSTQTLVGNRLFSFSMKYPGWFFTLLKGINKLGIVNSSVFKFVNFYIGDSQAREVLYKRWTCLRKLRPNLDQVKKLIRRYKIATRLVYGKYDRIILPVRGEKFQKGIEAYCQLSIINSGHQVLHENHIEGILKALQH